MKIKIRSNHHRFTILIPNWLLNEKIISWSLKQGQKHTDELDTISPELAIAVVKELKQSTKTFGHYELVRVESSDGDIVIVEM